MSTKLRAETMSADAASGRVVQRVFVMRHGEREDSRNPLWKKTAARPYDTPITGRGEREARLISGERFSDKARKDVCERILDIQSFYCGEV